MDLTLPAYTEYSVEAQDTQQLIEEIGQQAIRLQRLLQQNPRLKIQVTIDTIKYSIIEEDRQIDNNNERLQESSRTQKTIREVRNYLQESQPNPECIINLLVKENLEYYWYKYKNSDL